MSDELRDRVRAIVREAEVAASTRTEGGSRAAIAGIVDPVVALLEQVLWLHAEAVWWSEHRLEVGDRLAWRLVAAEEECARLRREVEFEANGAATFSGADAVAERGVNGVAFAVEDFGVL